METQLPSEPTPPSAIWSFSAFPAADQFYTQLVLSLTQSPKFLQSNLPPSSIPALTQTKNLSRLTTILSTLLIELDKLSSQFGNNQLNQSRNPNGLTAGKSKAVHCTCMFLSSILSQAIPLTPLPTLILGADLDCLLVAIMNFISASPPPATYDAHVGAMHLLLTLTSEQLYAPLHTPTSAEPTVLDRIYSLTAPFLAPPPPPGNNNNNNDDDYNISSPPAYNRNSTLLPPQPLSNSIDAAAFVSTCLTTFILRPSPPPKSASYQKNSLLYNFLSDTLPRGTFANLSDSEESIKKAVYSSTAVDETYRSSLTGLVGNILGVVLVPIRVVLALFSGDDRSDQAEDAIRNHHQQREGRRSHGSDENVFVSDSPVADLSSVLLLLLAHNNNKESAFHAAIVNLEDNRYSGGDLSSDSDGGDNVAVGFGEVTVNEYEGGDVEGGFIGADNPPPPSKSTNNNDKNDNKIISINFESVFNAFGSALSTEHTPMLLHTMMQSSPNFNVAVCSRSDLDTIVVPLLKTIYLASGTGKTGVCRTPEQIYIVLILLLQFSSDPSFPTDAFRRSFLPTVSFYKERNLKDVSLGSLVILVVLRLVTSTLNRTKDQYLLGNCEAVLGNMMGSAVQNLHPYAALRLVSVLIGTLQKLDRLKVKILGSKTGIYGVGGGSEAPLESAMEMTRTMCDTLLKGVNHAIKPEAIEGNVHLLYALIHKNEEWRELRGGEQKSGRIMRRIDEVVKFGVKILFENGQDEKSAVDMLNTIRENLGGFRRIITGQKNGERGGGSLRVEQGPPISNPDFALTDVGLDEEEEEEEEEVFNYVEEEDTESFFVPYLWSINCEVVAADLAVDFSKIELYEVEFAAEGGVAAAAGAVDEEVVVKMNGVDESPPCIDDDDDNNV